MDLLMEHVLLNLLKNAIRSVSEVNKGEIIIWDGQDRKYNYLFFKDTGLGIKPHIKKGYLKAFLLPTLKALV